MNHETIIDGKNTYTHRETIKQNGGKFDGLKKHWVVPGKISEWMLGLGCDLIERVILFRDTKHPEQQWVSVTQAFDANGNSLNLELTNERFAFISEKKPELGPVFRICAMTTFNAETGKREPMNYGSVEAQIAEKMEMLIENGRERSIELLNVLKTAMAE